MSFRPKNETAEDLANEHAAAELLCKIWDADVCKLSPMLYRVDWAFSRAGKVKAFAEFKRRSKKLDPVFIAAAKYMQLVELNRITNIPCLFIVQWPEGLWYHSVKYPSPLLNEMHMGGNSRGQNGDIEPMVHIPFAEFTEVKA